MHAGCFDGSAETVRPWTDTARDDPSDAAPGHSAECDYAAALRFCKKAECSQVLKCLTCGSLTCLPR